MRLFEKRGGCGVGVCAAAVVVVALCCFPVPPHFRSSALVGGPFPPEIEFVLLLLLLLVLIHGSVHREVFRPGFGLQSGRGIRTADVTMWRADDMWIWFHKSQAKGSEEEAEREFDAISLTERTE